MRTLAALLALMIVTGCSNGRGAPAPALTSLPQFARDQIDATAETSDPVPLDDLDLVDFGDADDFGDLLE